MHQSHSARLPTCHVMHPSFPCAPFPPATVYLMHHWGGAQIIPGVLSFESYGGEGETDLVMILAEGGGNSEGRSLSLGR